MQFLPHRKDPLVTSVCLSVRNLDLTKTSLKPRPNDRNMSTQQIATLLGAACCVRLATLCDMLRHVATCCDILGVVGSNLTSFKLEPTTPNTSQQGDQTHATCCAQQCCDMLCWHVAIVWPGLKVVGSSESNKRCSLKDVVASWRRRKDFKMFLYDT